MMNVLHFSERRVREKFQRSVHILILQCNVGGKTNEQNKSWMGWFGKKIKGEGEKKKILSKKNSFFINYLFITTPRGPNQDYGCVVLSLAPFWE